MPKQVIFRLRSAAYPVRQFSSEGLLNVQVAFISRQIGLKEANMPPFPPCEAVIPMSAQEYLIERDNAAYRGLLAEVKYSGLCILSLLGTVLMLYKIC